MKRIIFSIAFSVCLLCISAQTTSNFPGVTFRWFGGYAGQPGNTENIPAPVVNSFTPAVDAFGNLTNISAVDGTTKTVHNSYGQGYNIGFRIGYMFNQYIGVDLGAAYAQSTNISAYQQSILYQPDSLNNPQPSGGYLDNQLTTKSQSVILSPGIIVAFAKPKYKIYPYLRAGVALPVWTQITHKLTMGFDAYSANNVTYNSPYFLGNQTTVTMQTNTAFTVGFTGAIGAVWRPVNFVNFFVELGGQYLNIKGKNTTVTEWTTDGVDQIPYRGAYRDRFNYVKTLNANSNNAQYNPNYDPNAPKEAISPVFPFNNIGFNIGVQLVLNKKVFNNADGFDQDRSKKVKTPKVKKKKVEDATTTN